MKKIDHFTILEFIVALVLCTLAIVTVVLLMAAYNERKDDYIVQHAQTAMGTPVVTKQGTLNTELQVGLLSVNPQAVKVYTSIPPENANFATTYPDKGEEFLIVTLQVNGTGDLNPDSLDFYSEGEQVPMTTVAPAGYDRLDAFNITKINNTHTFYVPVIVKVGSHDLTMTYTDLTSKNILATWQITY